MKFDRSRNLFLWKSRLFGIVRRPAQPSFEEDSFKTDANIQTATRKTVIMPHLPGDAMKTAYDFKKLRRLMTIYAVVQVALVALLIYVALNFQAQLPSDRFLKTVVITLVIQTALFYPINKFANREAGREVDACAAGLTPEEMKSLRNKRLFGDVVKMSVFIFFVTFIWKAPPHPFFLSVVFFSFILTILSYFQCFNFAVRRQMREKG
jgi:hypothetical protein